MPLKDGIVTYDEDTYDPMAEAAWTESQWCLS